MNLQRGTQNGITYYVDDEGYFCMSGTCTSDRITLNLNELVFNGNGATSGEMQNIQVRTGETINLPQNQFEREYYDFVGWSFTPDGDAECDDKALFTMGPEEQTVLYAIWQLTNYKIKYNLNIVVVIYIII